MNVLPKRLGAALTAPSSQVSPYTKNCRDLPNTLCFPRIIECFISAWVYPYPESIKLINYFDILTRDKRPSVIVRLCPNVYHSSETKSNSVKSMIYIELTSRPKPALAASLPRGKTWSNLVSFQLNLKLYLIPK